MARTVNLHFRKKPVILATVLSAMVGATSDFKAEDFSEITVNWKGAAIDRGHVAAFNGLCGLKEGTVSPIYPLTLIYPLAQRILAQREAPLSLFRVLNSRIRQERPLGPSEIFDIECALSRFRIREKGLEVDISSSLRGGGETAWESLQTFYYRGRFGKPRTPASDTDEAPRLDPIAETEGTAEWFLPGGRTGLRFAAVSGDWNPIHYLRPYARLFGFRRDFAQPLLVLGNAFRYLPGSGEWPSASLDILLKGPFYYESRITLKRAPEGTGGLRFDICCEGNPSPCMSCNLEKP